MRRAALFAAAAIGLGFPAGLGLAVYMASGSSLAPPPASARVPTGTIAEPSLPPLTTDTTTTTDGDVSGNCDEPEHRLDPECLGGTTTDETTTEGDTTTTETEEDSSGKDKGKGRGRGRNRGHGGGDD